MKQRGRPAGGILLGVRKGINYKEFKSFPEGAWCRCEITIGSSEYNFISIYNNTSLRNIRKELELFLESSVTNGKAVIMGGDLNARCGHLGGLRENEDRATKDPKVDKEGEEWMEVYSTYGLTILNGNVQGDLDGHITRTGYTGQEDAVLDYVGVSSHKLSEFQQLRIGDQATSDHFPLEIICTPRVSTELEKPIYQQIWSEKNKRTFTEATKQPQCNGWTEIHKKLWQATPRKRVNTSKKQRWWNIECFQARKKMWEALTNNRANENDLSEKAKRTYKTTIKKPKRTI